MAEQGAPNPTHVAGHDETNKIAGEGAAVVSSTAAPSGGTHGAVETDHGPDARSDADPGVASGAPSPQVPTAEQPARSHHAQDGPRPSVADR